MWFVECCTEREKSRMDVWVQSGSKAIGCSPLWWPGCLVAAPPAPAQGHRRGLHRTSLAQEQIQIHNWEYNFYWCFCTIIKSKKSVSRTIAKSGTVCNPHFWPPNAVPTVKIASLTLSEAVNPRVSFWLALCSDTLIHSAVLNMDVKAVFFIRSLS